MGTKFRKLEVVSMNFYDKVYDMIRCLKETSEYKEFTETKKQVKENAELCKKITAFRELQQAEQMKYIKGVALDEVAKAKLSEMYADIVKDELGVKFFQLEIKLDVMLADMQKIISEGMQDIVEF